MKKINFLILLSLTLCDSFLFAHTGANTNEFETREGAIIETQKIKNEKQLGIDFHCWGTSFHYAVKIKKSLLLGFEIRAFLEKFNWVQRLVKHSQSDTVKKPESFWTTVVLGFIFAALMLFLNVPLAMGCRSDLSPLYFLIHKVVHHNLPTERQQYTSQKI